ncbi:hypothetical protein Dimus_034870 [Dionaea muscipula]
MRRTGGLLRWRRQATESEQGDRCLESAKMNQISLESSKNWNRHRSDYVLASYNGSNGGVLLDTCGW